MTSSKVSRQTSTRMLVNSPRDPLFFLFGFIQLYFRISFFVARTGIGIGIGIIGVDMETMLAAILLDLGLHFIRLLAVQLDSALIAPGKLVLAFVVFAQSTQVLLVLLLKSRPEGSAGDTLIGLVSLKHPRLFTEVEELSSRCRLAMVVIPVVDFLYHQMSGRFGDGVSRH